MNKTEMQKLAREFRNAMPLSSMGLTHLMDKGVEQIQNTTEADFTAAIRKEIRKAEESYRTYMLSEGASLELFRWAKRLAQYPILELVAALGSEDALGYLYNDNLPGRARCPHCGGYQFRKNDAEDGYVCAKCGQTVELAELQVSIDDDYLEEATGEQVNRLLLRMENDGDLDQATRVQIQGLLY